MSAGKFTGRSSATLGIMPRFSVPKQKFYALRLSDMWCGAIVPTVVHHVERKPSLVLAPRLRVTSRRTLVALCTMSPTWCNEWEASHSPPLGDVTKIYALYACIH